MTHVVTRAVGVSEAPYRLLFGGFLNSYGFYSILLLGFLTFTKIGRTSLGFFSPFSSEFSSIPNLFFLCFVIFLRFSSSWIR